LSCGGLRRKNALSGGEWFLSGNSRGRLKKQDGLSLQRESGVRLVRGTERTRRNKRTPKFWCTVWNALMGENNFFERLGKGGQRNRGGAGGGGGQPWKYCNEPWERGGSPRRKVTVRKVTNGGKGEVE